MYVKKKKNPPYDSGDIWNEIVSIPIAWKELKLRLRGIEHWLDWVLIPIISISIFIIISIVSQLFLIGYVYLIIDGFISDDPYMGFGGTMLLGVLWLVLIFIRIDIYKKEDTKRNVRQMGRVLAVTIAIILLWIYNKEKSSQVLNGQGAYEVTLEFEDKTINSDTNLVYIGKTSEYVFLRNRSNDINQIYKIEKLIRINQKSN